MKKGGPASLFHAFDFSRGIQSGSVYVGVRAGALVRLSRKVLCFEREYEEASGLRDIKCGVKYRILFILHNLPVSSSFALFLFVHLCFPSDLSYKNEITR